MFVLKKNSYKVTLLAKFLLLDSLLNIFMPILLSSFVYMCKLGNMPVEFMCLMNVCFLIFFHALWCSWIFHNRDHWGVFLPKSLAAVALLSNVYYTFIMLLFIFMASGHLGNDSDLVTLVAANLSKPFAVVLWLCLVGMIRLSPAIEFWLSLQLLRITQRGSIATFFVPSTKDFLFVFFVNEPGNREELPGKPLHVISSSAVIHSTTPEYNRTVDIANSYLGINNNCDLEIAECGKLEKNVIVIPKETVTSVTFTLLTGGERKMCYGESGWQLPEESA